MTENRSISEEIQTQIDHTIQNQPYPTEAKIVRVYPNNYADIQTDDYGQINYVRVYGECELGTVGILFFLHGSYDYRVVITSNALEDYTTLLNAITELEQRVTTLENNGGILNDS